ncbi:hypothetical protein ACFFWC_29740 [Plantactinospora siamensis]|uniref:Uncharacterized protein n=1 Tax=Plantactinospora siamensis TaxID=555372 RepID=A0ABV6NP98_9ACTN
MGEAYGWTDNGRQVFDPVRLEQAAAELRQKQKPNELQQQLLSNLIPPAAFGNIDGSQAVAERLFNAYQSMLGELEKVGLDISDLASRTLAAAQLAHDVDPATQAAARRGHVPLAE